MPNLQAIQGSENCIGGSSYKIQKQTNHGCMFYGTSFTNDALLKIGDEYSQRQTDCINAGNNFNNDEACKVSNTEFVKITGSSVQMKITAMALPWGGLSDIKGTWVPSHYTHNDGKNVDIGFDGLSNTDPHIKLLRDVILDNGGTLPVSNEGGDMTKTKDHFHVRFPN